MDTRSGCHIIERIDAGGQIAFFRAEHPDFGSVCLVEACAHSWPPWADPGLFALLPAHSNVVRLHKSDLGGGTSPDRVILEWVEGEDLRERVLRAGPLSEFESIRIAAQVCTALEELQRGIPLASGQQLPCSHGNVHPRWIHLEGSLAKLGGWGLGTLKPEASEIEPMTRLIDHLSMPPEKFSALSPEPNVASDIFGLGAVLHFALTGRSPYGDDLSLDLLGQLRSHGQWSDLPVEKQLPTLLRNTISQLVDIDPRQRPSLSRAKEMLSVLLAAAGKPSDS